MVKFSNYFHKIALILITFLSISCNSTQDDYPTSIGLFEGLLYLQTDNGFQDVVGSITINTMNATTIRLAEVVLNETETSPVKIWSFEEATKIEKLSQRYFSLETELDGNSWVLSGMFEVASDQDIEDSATSVLGELSSKADGFQKYVFIADFKAPASGEDAI